MPGSLSRSNIVKALALGADAVLLGRASLYGVAAAGEAGTARALDLLAEELRRTFNLMGCPDIDDLSAEWLTFNLRPAVARAY